jgi:hypothetical protein
MESIKPCAARRVSLNTFNDQHSRGKVRIALRSVVKKVLLTHTSLNSFIISQKVMEPRLMRALLMCFSF